MTSKEYPPEAPIQSPFKRQNPQFMKIIFLFLSLMVSKILEISMWKHSRRAGMNPLMHEARYAQQSQSCTGNLRD